MEISINKKALIVSGLSLSLLAGCLDDPYTYPEEEVVPPPSDTANIYGPASDGTFALSVMDSDELQALIDADGFVSQGNIATSNISGQAQGNLNLRITNEANARFIAHSSNSANLDMGIADPATSTLQFDLRVLGQPAIDQTIYLTNQREETVDIGNVSLTSAMMAYSNAAPQTVKVPLSCFTDAGMDYRDAFSPFVLHSSSDLNVDIGNIRVMTNSIEEAHVLACHTESTLVKPDGDTNVSKMFVVDAPDGQGWATALGTWMTDGSHIQVDWGHDSFTLTHTNAGDGANGGVILNPSDALPRDMALFMESGVLEFMMNVESYGTHPTKRFQVQMESPDGNSQPYFLPAGFAENEWLQVRIPLKTLFTHPDGSVDVNVLRNITKPLSLLPEWVEAGNTLQGMKYTLSGVKLVLN